MKLSIALFVVTAAAIAITQSSATQPGGFLARRRLAQATESTPMLADDTIVAPATLLPASLPASLDDPAASDLAARLSQTMSPAQICVAAKEIYGTVPPQCAGIDTAGVVKKIISIPVETGPADPRDSNNDGGVDILDGPVDVEPLTSGVEVAGRAGRVLAALVAGAAAGTVLLL